MSSSFTPNSVAFPLSHREFDHLDTKTKKKLARLMARISEKSYRRGFQHGGLEGRTVDPVELRFNTPLKHSPWTDAVNEKGKWENSRHSSLERLFMEYSELVNLGFYAPKFK